MKEVSQAIEKAKQEVQLSEWAKDMEQQRQEGLCVEEWCENAYSVHRVHANRRFCAWIPRKPCVDSVEIVHEFRAVEY